jgi:serine/threonine protein kinase
MIQGYVKIVDFGFAKHVGNNHTYTFCGTPDYLCPEIISNTGHSCAVDWWCLGIFIFEMLTGETPFFSENVLSMYKKITEVDYKFPKGFPKDAEDLVSKLLVAKPTKRYGPRSSLLCDILMCVQLRRNAEGWR